MACTTTDVLKAAIWKTKLFRKLILFEGIVLFTFLVRSLMRRSILPVLSMKLEQGGG